MKRSEINAIIRDAVAFFEQCRFKLPPFAFWTPRDWESKGHECDEIRDNMLGWDITDFGSGEFNDFGLLLFTIRNGNLKNDAYPKPYAEKIMIARENQIVPMHFHWQKMEDIINRGGGNLIVQIYNSAPDEKLDDTPVEISLDGVSKFLPAGSSVSLSPGESITLPPRIYHKFHAENGKVLIGEVSSVNDDETDNRFLEPLPRFADIEEDEPILYYLCNEYPPAKT